MVKATNFKRTIVSIKCSELDKLTEEWLVANKPYGIILFKENIVNLEQLKRLIADIKSLYSPAPVFSIDFEGGNVNRLSAITGDLLPPIRQKSIYDFGKYSGELLSKLGIEINFAPVVDLDFGIKGNGLDTRYLGISAGQVVENAEKYLQGLESFGITGCIKHYPGLGKIGPDTHFSLSEIDDFDSNQENPFIQLTKENRLIMVAHLYIRKFKEISTFSDYLVRRIKSFHKGLIITDDLSMKALSEEDDDVKIEKSLKSGFDLALIRFNNPIFENKLIDQ